VGIPVFYYYYMLHTSIIQALLTNSLLPMYCYHLLFALCAVSVCFSGTRTNCCGLTMRMKHWHWTLRNLRNTWLGWLAIMARRKLSKKHLPRNFSRKVCGNLKFRDYIVYKVVHKQVEHTFLMYIYIFFISHGVFIEFN